MSAGARRRAQVVRYGVDTEAVLAAAAGERDAVRVELGIEPDELVVGTVANLRRTKAYPDLLVAARDVIDAVPGVRFVAVGQGPHEAAVRALHTELGLGNRFVLAGYRADAVRVMSAFDVFCLASHHEGLPIALMEALTIGLPVVATDVGGVHELGIGGDGAVLVPPARPDLLAKALIDVLTDDAARAAMAVAARRRGAELGVGHAVRRMEQLYAEACDR
jgi:glycosyltransferase involved in cell wall biosynthesis